MTDPKVSGNQPNRHISWSGFKTRIKSLASTYGNEMWLRFDGERIYIQGSKEVIAFNEMKQILPSIFKVNRISSLIITYEGPELWALFKPRTEKKLQYWLARQIPPKKEISDYHVSFHAIKDHGCIGLLPRTICDPFFDLAEECNLITCQVQAISLKDIQESGLYMIPFSKVAWFVDSRKGVVQRLIPTHPNNPSFPGFGAFQVIKSEVSNPLFLWVDPRQKARVKAHRDQMFLKLAGFAVLILFGLAWLGLVLFGAFLEKRLDDYTASQSKIEVHQKKYVTTYKTYESLIEELDQIVTTEGAQIPVAVTFRQIMILCPQSFVFTNLLYNREGLAFNISGYAPQQVEMTAYLKKLKTGFPEADIKLIHFRLLTEPVSDKLLQVKGVVTGMYHFQITLGLRS